MPPQRQLKQRLIFCTFNPNKAEEIRQMLPAGFQLHTATDVGLMEPVPETGLTLEENALIKARSCYLASGLPTFADDTGLEVDALEGAPGVFSARFAGPEATHQDNMAKLLRLLQGVPEAQRTARFRTIIAYIDAQGQETLVEGALEGRILAAPQGEGGFGYDPIFIPQGETRSLAQHSPAEKNAISHRGIAFRAFMAKLGA